MAMAYGPGYSVITMSHWCRHLITARLLLILPGYSMVHEFFARLWPLTTVTPSTPHEGHEGIGLRARHGNGSLRIRSISPRASCSKAATAKIPTVLNPRPVSAAQTAPEMVSSLTKASTVSIKHLVRTAHSRIAWKYSSIMAAQTVRASPRNRHCRPTHIQLTAK
jgi:hypothetical protein